MDQKRNTRRKKVCRGIASIVIGGVVAWFLLSKIELGDIPRAIGNISLRSLATAFLLYAIATFFKAVRFRMILRTGISLGILFPIVSLYMFFANILPMRTGELSYIYLLKKQSKTPGAKSFASLVVGAIADIVVILAGILVVGLYLGEALTEGAAYLLSALKHSAGMLAQRAGDNLLSFIVVVVFLAAIVVGLILLAKRGISRQHRIWQYVRSKIMEVGRELADTPLDVRLLGVFFCSILIIVFRFGAQCYLVRAMDIDIGIWKLSFALLFGVLFSMLPIHGPAGFGTVEAPWVMILCVLNVPKEDAITSGFSLHIIIIMYAIIMGIYGALSLRISRYAQNRNSITG